MAAALPLTGRVAIITGASRGIGRAIALHLSSLGASVVLAYVSSSDEADRLAADINSSSPSPGRPLAVAVRTDVSDPAAVQSLFETAEQTFLSPPHIVVHSAGIIDHDFHPISTIPVSNFDSIIAVNLRGSFLVLREAANRVVRGGGGRIIALSSSLVAINRPGYGAYTASKAAVEALVATMAKELKGTRITANCVAPGPVATELFLAGKSDEDVQRLADMIPMGRIGVPEDITPAVGLLCSDAGEWINGQVIRVNGGLV